MAAMPGGGWGGRPDAIVAGGGVVDCRIACRLATDGRRVPLLERRGLAAGASGHNGGMTGGSSLHAGTPAGRAVAARAARAALGVEAFAAAWEAGRALPLAEAVAAAVVDPAALGRSARSPPRWREWGAIGWA
jgi:choline dehydrogenase-like flavoprotein